MVDERYAPTYSFVSAYTGVSVNSTSGVVTIQSSTTAGTAKMQAKYGTLTAVIVDLAMSEAAPVATTIAFTQSSYIESVFNRVDVGNAGCGILHAACARKTCF